MSSPFAAFLPSKEKNPNTPLRYALAEDEVSSRLEKYASSGHSRNKHQEPRRQKFVRSTALHSDKKPKPSEARRDDNYRAMLKYSRNYAQLMADLDNGTVPEDVLPQKRPAQVEEQRPENKLRLFAMSQQMLQREESRPKTVRKSKSGVGMLNGPEIWCARCSKKHPADFHKRKVKTVRPLLVHQHREDVRGYAEEYDEDSDLSGFIESDEDVQPSQVSQTIRKMFNYDPSRYRNIDRLDDRYMEATAETILREDRQSARIGAHEDREELLRQLAKKHR